MKKLTFTKKEAIKLHRKMWHWLAKNPTKDKLDWPEWENFKYVQCNCFACQYAYNKGNSLTNCSLCPFEWGNGTGCYSGNSPYRKWYNLNEFETEQRAKYALEVATLKERKLSK